MTNVVTPPNRWFVNRPSQSTRTTNTLPPELMELARKRAIAARIKDARERSKWKQPQVATRLGIGLRAYQKVEQYGTSSFERCEELAEFFAIPGVTADYLWEGHEQTPDLLGTFSESTSAADLASEIRELQSETAELRSEVSEVRSDLANVLSLLRHDGHDREGGGNS